MKRLLLIIALVPQWALAHCPISFEIDGETYCTQVQWLSGDKKVAGQLESTNTTSPYLIPKGDVPQKWIYSRAEFTIWRDGDASHASQNPAGLRIFPYMIMEDGHHHGTSYDFSWNAEEEKFSLYNMSLQTMRGCWSLRWTTTDTNDLLETSQPLLNIKNYSNLDAAQNLEMDGFCAQETSPGDGHGDHHHH